MNNADETNLESAGPEARLGAWLRAGGAVLHGVASAREAPWAGRFLAWLDRGQHADMHWLLRSAEKRMDPRRVLPGCRSVVVAAWPSGRRTGAIPPGHGRLAAFLGEEDYHRRLEERLSRVAALLSQELPGEQVKTYVDTGPVLEREWAVLAGLGWIGKNTLLLHPRQGSFLLLGVMLTTAALRPTPAFTGHHCGTCTRCLAACPTQALSEEHGLDTHRCLGYWNVEHKGPFTNETPPADQWQGWLYGCDICQDVCPFNRHAPEAPGPKDLPLAKVLEGEVSLPGHLRRGPEGLRRNAAWLSQTLAEMK